MKFIKATIHPKPGTTDVVTNIVLNAASIIGVMGSKIVLSIETMEIISRQVYNGANKVSYLSVGKETEESLLGKG
jgi:hypothetical protein